MRSARKPRTARLAGGQPSPADRGERQIRKGRALLGLADARQSAGTYVIQAAIADLHLQQPATGTGSLARRLEELA